MLFETYYLLIITRDIITYLYYLKLIFYLKNRITYVIQNLLLIDYYILRI